MTATGRRSAGAGVACLAALALAAMVAATASAQTAAPAAAEKKAPPATVGFDTLRGTWVRPDGGYRIVIGSVAADGRIEATYYNPSPLPFAKAQASMNGTQLHASFELRAGGYDGSTYELKYDPASDRLIGVYFQAVAKQKYDIYFMRR